MNPPTRIEIIILIVLSVVLVVLLHGTIYTKLKLRYGKTRREILRLEIIVLKSAIIDTLRLALLSLVISLPLIGLGISTALSVVSAVIFEDSLLGKVQVSVNIENIISFLSLLASIILMHYFLDRYGAVYKLPLMYFVRDDIRRFLKKHLDIYAMLLIGFTTYVVIIIALLEMLVDTLPILPKEIAGTITVFLLIEVLPNKKYENAMKLCKKFTSYS